MGTTDEDQDAADDDRDRPRIDVSPALGEAGHEEELLGTVGVPDTAPLVQHPGDPIEDTEEQIQDAVVTRGISPVD
jgi:hypothetical protein